MFGDRLKELRKNKNISQEELGNFCEVAKTTISNWENNITQPPIEIIIKLAEYFGVTVDYLLCFNQDDLNNIERLKTILKEAGMWDEKMNDITMEDLEKALKIVNMMKEDKDTKN